MSTRSRSRLEGLRVIGFRIWGFQGLEVPGRCEEH